MEISIKEYLRKIYQVLNKGILKEYLWFIDVRMTPDPFLYSVPFIRYMVVNIRLLQV